MRVVNTNYPKQIISYVHSDKTFCVDENLNMSLGSVMVGGNDEYRKPVPPLQVPGYSVFKITLLEKGNYASANLPESDVDFVYKKTQLLLARDMFKGKENTKSDGGEKSSAYTLKFKLGECKGLSPAQVVVRDGNTTLLEKQKNFLKLNVDKYPANKTLINAIDEAIKLFQAGKLGEVETSSDSITDVYVTETKYLTSDIKNDKYFVYKLEIRKNIEMNLPYEVKITNAYAPLRVTSTGTKVPDMTKAELKKSITMLLSEKEWSDAITEMNLARQNFSQYTFGARYENAKKISKENQSQNQTT